MLRYILASPHRGSHPIFRCYTKPKYANTQLTVHKARISYNGPTQPANTGSYLVILWFEGQSNLFVLDPRVAFATKYKDIPVDLSNERKSYRDYHRHIVYQAHYERKDLPSDTPTYA